MTAMSPCETEGCDNRYRSDVVNNGQCRECNGEPELKGPPVPSMSPGDEVSTPVSNYVSPDYRERNQVQVDLEAQEARGRRLQGKLTQ